MLRWKLFLPLAIGLTVVALIGSYYWSATASNRYLSSLNNQAVAEIALEGNRLSIQIEGGQALIEILSELDSEQVNKLSAGKYLRFERVNAEPLDSFWANQVDLIVAQAAATREYYHGHMLLEDLAADLGLEADLFIWEGRLVAEVSSQSLSYISQRPLYEEVSR